MLLVSYLDRLQLKPKCGLVTLLQDWQFLKVACPDVWDTILTNFKHCLNAHLTILVAVKSSRVVYTCRAVVHTCSPSNVICIAK